MTEIETIIRDTRAIAIVVAEGSGTGLSKAHATRSIRKYYPELLGNWSEVNTVDKVICLGVQLLVAWMMEQKGPGVIEWIEKLQGWLDDWENDFGQTPGARAREVAGFAYLIALLDLVAEAIRDSEPLQ